MKFDRRLTDEIYTSDTVRLGKNAFQAAQDAIAILQQTFKYGNPNTIIKTAVALQGHPVGKCRAPFNYVPEEGMEAIKKVLAENAAKGLN